MTDERCGHAVELRRTPGERAEPRRDHGATRPDALAVGEHQREALPVAVDAIDAAGVQVRSGLALKPVAVGDEVGNANGRRARLLLQGGMALECQAALGIGDVGAVGPRPQPHAARHMALPELHRATKNARVHAGGSKVGDCRQTVRAGADDGDVAVIAVSRHAGRNGNRYAARCSGPGAGRCTRMGPRGAAATEKRC